MNKRLLDWYDLPQIDNSWTHPKYGRVKYDRHLGVYKVVNKHFWFFIDAIQYATKRSS